MKDSGGATPYIDDRLKREQWSRGRYYLIQQLFSLLIRRPCGVVDHRDEEVRALLAIHGTGDEERCALIAVQRLHVGVILIQHI